MVAVEAAAATPTSTLGYTSAAPKPHRAGSTTRADGSATPVRDSTARKPAGAAGAGRRHEPAALGRECCWCDDASAGAYTPDAGSNACDSRPLDPGAGTPVGAASPWPIMLNPSPSHPSNSGPELGMCAAVADLAPSADAAVAVWAGLVSLLVSGSRDSVKGSKLPSAPHADGGPRELDEAGVGGTEGPGAEG